MVAENLRIYSVKITGKYICESKNLICSFLLMPPSKTFLQDFIITPEAEESTHSSQTVFSEDLFFPQQKGGERIMELKKLPILYLQEHWSLVLMNSTLHLQFKGLQTLHIWFMFCCAII